MQQYGSVVVNNLDLSAGKVHCTAALFRLQECLLLQQVVRLLMASSIGVC
jgi:hypothetical protein